MKFNVPIGYVKKSKAYRFSNYFPSRLHWFIIFAHLTNHLTSPVFG